MLKTLLSHPLSRGLRIDDPCLTELRQQIIQQKPFLRQIYSEWYSDLVNCLPIHKAPILELGSGGGFLADYIPGLITSETFHCRGIRAVLSGAQLPFADGVLGGIVMTDVFHHVSRPRAFLAEALRCVQPGGVLAMNEPWVTSWSRLIYRHLHHEPFEPEAAEWEFCAHGPLSGANSALPWIVFERDRQRFEQEFPDWKIREIRLRMPFRYLVSGGVSMRTLMPGCTFKAWRCLEDALQPWMGKLAMFALIVLKKVDA
jgi:SAM-dependent methyltransferase